MHHGEGDLGEPGRVARPYDTLLLREGDQFGGDLQAPVAEFAEFGAGVVGVLGREHQAQQRGVRDGEADVRAAHAGEPGGDGAGLAHGGPEAFVEPGEAAHGERVQQGLPVAEVAARRRMTDAEVPREGAEGEAVRPRGREHVFRARQQGLPEIAVVIGRIGVGQGGLLPRCCH